MKSEAPSVSSFYVIFVLKFEDFYRMLKIFKYTGGNWFSKESEMCLGKKKKKKSTTLGIPRRSPIQVLTKPDVA